MKNDSLPPRVAAMLHNRRVKSAKRKGHKIYCVKAEGSVMIHIFLADNNGVFVDLVSLRTDEDGFIHPLQAVYEIMKVWDVAIDHMLWKENDC